MRLRDIGASVPMVVVSDVLSRVFEALDASDDALPTEEYISAYSGELGPVEPA